MSDLTAGVVVDRALNTWLLGTYSAQFNALAAGCDANDLELTCALTLGEIGASGFIAIDNELCYVVDRDTTNQRIVVVRGVRGTTAAAHLAGAAVEINPRFPRFMVRSVMSEELEALPDTLYVPKQATVAVGANGGWGGVPVTADGFTVRDVVHARRASLSSLDERFRRTDGYEVQMDPAGGGRISLDVDIAVATTYKLTLACDFKTSLLRTLGDACDLVTDVGLAPGMVEILELGAAYRLLIGRSSVRLFPEAQGQARNAADVRASDMQQFAASMLKLKEFAIARETQRLYKRYGFGGQ
jgi:hypothetical protein